MLDIGWSELLVIGVVALIVVGPKDLPILFRRMGEFTGKARAMAREFTSAMDKAADETGVRDIQKNLRNAANPRQMGLDALNETARDLKDWHKDGPSEKTAGKQSGQKPEAAKPAEPKSAAAGDADKAAPGAGADISADAAPAAADAPAGNDEKTA